MSWIMVGTQLTNTDFVNAPSEPFHGDSPYTMWRVDPDINDGMPYVGLMVGVPAIAPEPPPHFEPVPQRDYVTVYDLRTEQDGFENHGIVILQPTLCRITEALNGEYSVSLEHPIDDLGRWTYLIEMNILKVNGQLFVIKKVNQNFNNGKGYVSVQAMHIFYAQNDRFIMKGTYMGAGASYDTATADWWIKSANYFGHYRRTNPRSTPWYPEPQEGEILYDYTASSNISGSLYYMRHDWSPLPKGMTPVDFIFNELMTYSGGEIYRDNFYYSLNERKEHTKDNAFEIRFGHNLTGIQRNVDTSEMCTYMVGTDAYGNKFKIEVSGEAPQRIVREIVFDNDDVVAADRLTRLIADTTAEFDKCKLPKLTYRVNLIDTFNNPEFEEVTKHADYTVGNTGYIYDERLEKLGLEPRNEVKVTRTIVDALTGRTIEVEFGDIPSLTRPRKTGRKLSQDEIDEMYKLIEVEAKALGNWLAVSNYIWGDLAKFTWYQCEGNASTEPR